VKARLRVHVSQEYPPADQQRLCELLADDPVDLTFDAEAPPDFDVLVEGVPGEAVLDHTPSLRAVVVPWTGPPPVTIERLRTRPRLSLHNLHHNDSATAEMAVTLLLAAAKVTVPRHNAFRSEGWPERQWFDRSSILLEGKGALVLGYGAIGRRVARMLAATGMVVRATRRSARDVSLEDGVEVHPAGAWRELLPLSHVLMVTLPLTTETEGMVDATALAALARPSLVVNVGRGPVVRERDLYEALRDGVVDRAGIDVWWRYRSHRTARGTEGDDHNRPSSFPFEELGNLVMSPHRGGITDEDQVRRITGLAEVLRSGARGGELMNRVDLEAGY
jgi:phosphoglycerate dehydrogenase-like enzyme